MDQRAQAFRRHDSVGRTFLRTFLLDRALLLVALASLCALLIADPGVSHAVVMTNSADAAGGNCDVVPPPKDEKPPFGLPPGPVNPCKARTGKINSFFNQASNADNRDANQAGADPFVQCVPSEGVDCPCVDPATCGEFE